MRQSLLDAEVDANELLEGKARAFVHVHTSGMLDLVTSSHTVKSEVTPETLLFDVHRAHAARGWSAVGGWRPRIR